MNPKSEIGLRDQHGLTPLHVVAATSGSFPELRALLANGANPNARTRSAGVVDVLLDAGANPDMADEAGLTALQYAVAPAASADTVKALLKAGADLEVTDETGRTPLQAAVLTTSSADMVRALVKAGAGLDIRDGHGQTLLHVASANRISPERSLGTARGRRGSERTR